MAMPAAANELYQAVLEATQDTPYVVTPTDKGFDVTLDVVDAKWWTLFARNKLSMVYTHHVEVPAPGRYKVTDDLRRVEWTAGVPHVSAQAERVSGRVVSYRREIQLGIRDDATVGKVVDYTFSSEEGRKLVTAAAKRLGFSQGLSTNQKIGLAAAAFGLVMAGVGGWVAYLDVSGQI